MHDFRLVNTFPVPGIIPGKDHASIYYRIISGMIIKFVNEYRAPEWNSHFTKRGRLGYFGFQDNITKVSYLLIVDLYSNDFRGKNLGSSSTVIDSDHGCSIGVD